MYDRQERAASSRFAPPPSGRYTSEIDDTFLTSRKFFIHVNDIGHSSLPLVGINAYVATEVALNLVNIAVAPSRL